MAEDARQFVDTLTPKWMDLNIGSWHAIESTCITVDNRRHLRQLDQRAIDAQVE